MQLEENIGFQAINRTVQYVQDSCTENFSVKLLRKLLDIIFMFYRKHTLKGVCNPAGT